MRASLLRVLGGGFIAVFALAGCAGVKVPQIDLNIPEPVWISPANQDGVQDSFSVPVSVLPDSRMAIDAYRIAVVDNSGQEVMVVERAVEGASFLDSLLMDLRLRRRVGVEVPELIVWDGRNAAGQFVADGAYTISLEVLSGKSRIASPAMTVIVDNTAPTASLSAEYLMFSPNADGRKDTVPIRQLASEEKSWTGTIHDAAGRVVLTRNWTGLPEAVFEWNGQDSSGRRVPDGLYEYRLEGVDLAGNRFSTNLRNLAVNTTAVPFFIGVSGRAFSPNGDGVRDTLLVQPVLDSLQGTLHWTLEILDEAGRMVNRFANLPFRPFGWTGQGSSGEAAAEGKYWLRVTVEFENGNAPQRLSDPVVLDRTLPRAQVNKSATVFSPDGDGRLDTIRFTVQEANKTAEWRAEIINLDQSFVAVTRSWTGLPSDFEWDGLEDDGMPAPEGRYVYRLSAEDEAGNSFNYSTQPFVLDIRDTPATLRLAASGFSPNGDGYKDTLSLDLYLPVRDGIDSWSFRVRGRDGNTVRTVSGRDSFPDLTNFVWDGKDDAGFIVPDGSYQVTFNARYAKGNEAAASSSFFALDTSPPRVQIGLSPLPFSPDDDGFNDMLDIRLTIADQSAVSDWEVLIRDRQGNLFQRFAGTGSPAPVIKWNGKSPSGELVFSAEDYGLEVLVRDSYGNLGRGESSIPVDILVIKEGNRYRIRVPGIYFSPFTADFPADKAADNMATLRRLAEVLAKYPDYNIRVEGNAVRVNWADRARGEAEEREVLAPLSLARANRVRSILITMGIGASRLSAAGLGGTMPLVPHSDLDNRWKNRRVDFVLIRR